MSIPVFDDPCIILSISQFLMLVILMLFPHHTPMKWCPKGAVPAIAPVEKPQASPWSKQGGQVYSRIRGSKWCLDPLWSSLLLRVLWLKFDVSLRLWDQLRSRWLALWKVVEATKIFIEIPNISWYAPSMTYKLQNGQTHDPRGFACRCLQGMSGGGLEHFVTYKGNNHPN